MLFEGKSFILIVQMLLPLLLPAFGHIPLDGARSLPAGEVRITLDAGFQPVLDTFSFTDHDSVWIDNVRDLSSHRNYNLLVSQGVGFGLGRNLEMGLSLRLTGYGAVSLKQSIPLMDGRYLALIPTVSYQNVGRQVKTSGGWFFGPAEEMQEKYKITEYSLPILISHSTKKKGVDVEINFVLKPSYAKVYSKYAYAWQTIPEDEEDHEWLVPSYDWNRTSTDWGEGVDVRSLSAAIAFRNKGENTNGHSFGGAQIGLQVLDWEGETRWFGFAGLSLEWQFSRRSRTSQPIKGNPAVETEVTNE